MIAGNNAIRNIATSRTPINYKNISNLANNSENMKNFRTDFADFIGWGTARRQREYEQHLANTAYQRAVADMKAAGLNPAQMFAGGGQAAQTATYGSATQASLGGMIGTLTGIANVVNAFNRDKNEHNDMSQRNAIHFLNTAAKIMKMFK